MSQGSVQEYVEAIMDRYRRDKQRVLDAFTRVTGYHGKVAIRLYQSQEGGWIP